MSCFVRSGVSHVYVKRLFSSLKDMNNGFDVTGDFPIEDFIIT